MNLSISNIAWAQEKDSEIYAVMRRLGVEGVEIAPTRVFPENPYERCAEAGRWSAGLGFAIPSMQSIWYGRTEKIFTCAEEREILAEYTRQAIQFAAAIHCRNLVFGCPRNRDCPPGTDPGIAVSFFRTLAGIASQYGCVIGMEANPPIYNTNFVNDTLAALELVQQVAHPNFMLNLDVGAMVCNGEGIGVLRGNVRLISHVHISEPWLKPIEPRPLHRELAALLRDEGYQGYVSIEMGRQEDCQTVANAMEYVKEIFS